MSPKRSSHSLLILRELFGNVGTGGPDGAIVEGSPNINLNSAGDLMGPTCHDARGQQGAGKASLEQPTSGAHRRWIYCFSAFRPPFILEVEQS